MEVHKIFSDIYAIKYDDQPLNEFRRLFSEWSDPEYLERFFETHKADLNTEFYHNMSVERAMLDTLDDADSWRRR